jgi:GrpB-like predicted nucleotidyltransferase (UPF0157 family)/GNAT superfamily N-acetyltransferase
MRLGTPKYRSVRLVEHEPEWQQEFERERARIASVLGSRLRGIEHVGSTAIAGIHAKPVIDIALGLDELDTVQQLLEPMAELGYDFPGDIGISGERIFGRGPEMRTHLVHAVVHGGAVWNNYLRFRDALRNDARLAAAYDRLKLALAQQYPEDRGAYTEGKATFIDDVLRRTDLRVRRALPDDADTVTRIYVTSWNAGFGSRMPVIAADAARVSRWRAELARDPPMHWWVAERDGEIVGFVGVGPSRHPRDPTLGEVDTIAVDPSAWRSSVGAALMRTAVQRLRADGYRAGVLWTLSRYPLGESFYRSMGWRLNGATRRGGEEVRYDFDLS